MGCNGARAGAILAGMRKLLLLCLLLAPVLGWGQTTKELDQKNGFRDLKFGAPALGLTGLKVVMRSGGNVFYSRPADNMNVGAAALENIVYVFYKGQLKSVIITTKGSANGSALLAALRASYGLGEQKNKYLEEYTWAGETVYMSFDQAPVTKDATVYMGSIPINRAEAADDEIAAKKAKSDL